MGTRPAASKISPAVNRRRSDADAETRRDRAATPLRPAASVVSFEDHAAHVGTTRRQRAAPVSVRHGTIPFGGTRPAFTDAARTGRAMRRLQHSLEQQATRLAGVLHDDLGQALAFAQVTVVDVARDLPPAAQARLQDARRQLDRVATELRRVAQELHPSILDHVSLSDAVTFSARAFARRTGIRLSVDAAVDEPCEPGIASVAYRFVQEALATIEYAHVTSGSIAVSSDGASLVCALRADGTGFDSATTLMRDGDHSVGLLMIRDRIEAAGGSLELVSAPRRAIELRAVIPLEG